MPGKHAYLSPSAASRWTSCPSSAYREHQAGLKFSDRGSSPAAAEGILAHSYFEKLMQTGSFDSDEDMKDHLLLCRAALTKNYPGQRWNTEVKIPIYKAFGVPENILFGTADLLGTTSETLMIVDLKYGKYPVSPVENDQLILYAIGAAEATGWRHLNVDLVILQPRAKGRLFKRWSLTLNQLRDHRDRLLQAVKAQNKTDVVAGSYCYFCKAIACPTRVQPGVSNEELSDDALWSDD